MKRSMLGYCTNTGVHDSRMTREESRFVGILFIDHVGENNALSADKLALRYRFYGQDNDFAEEWLKDMTLEKRRALERWKRIVRKIYNHLLFVHDRIRILSCAGHDGGYYIANSDEEVKKFFGSFRKRGLTGLTKASRGKKAEMVDIVTQLSFEFDDLVDKAGISTPEAEFHDAPIEIVDAFLGKMMAEPEKFADGLRKIGNKYGSVLLPKGQVKAMQAKALELQELVSSMVMG